MVNRSVGKRWLLWVPLAFLCACSAGSDGGGGTRGEADVFAARIQPILNQNCSCHGVGTASTTNSGLLLVGEPDAVYQSVMNSPNGIVAGRANASKMIEAMDRGRMPQGGAMQGSPALETIVAWVNDGAHRYGEDTGETITTGPVPEPPTQFVTAAQAVEMAKFKYEILSIANTAPGQKPAVTFRVVNPTLGTTDPGYAYSNVLTTYPLCTTTIGTTTSSYKCTPPWYYSNGGASSGLTMVFGWDTADYSNESYGIGTIAMAGQPTTVAVLTAKTVKDNLDGTYTVTAAKAIPAGATGSGVVALNGHPVAVVGTTAILVPVRNLVTYFPITDATPVARRTVVDVAKCNQCHGHISLHGNNRTDEPALCVVCHNSNATDISRRPTSGPTADGKLEQTVDFKFLQHSLHTKNVRDGGIRAYPIFVYGYGGSPNDFRDTVYPAVLRDCEVCHLPGTFDLKNNLAPGSKPKLGTSVDTGADKFDPTDDHRISAQSASCYGCHDSENAWMHMQRFNGKFYALQSEIAAGPQESCGNCHDDREIRESHKMPPALVNPK